MLAALPPGTSLFSIEGARAVLRPLTAAAEEMNLTQKIALVAAAILLGIALGGACAVTCSFFRGSVLPVSSSALLALGIGSGATLFGGAAVAFFVLASARAGGEARVEELPGRNESPRGPARLPEPYPAGEEGRVEELPDRDEFQGVPDAPELRVPIPSPQELIGALDRQRCLDDLWNTFEQTFPWFMHPQTTDHDVASQHYDWYILPVSRRSARFGERFTITDAEVPQFVQDHPQFRTHFLTAVHRILHAWDSGEAILPIRAGKMADSLRLFMPSPPAQGELQSEEHAQFVHALRRLQQIIQRRGVASQLVGPNLEWAHLAIFERPYTPPADAT